MCNRRSFLFYGLVFLLFSIIVFLPGLLSQNIGYILRSDQLVQCYALFNYVGERLREGFAFGPDLLTFNGASEIFHRANMPTSYLPLYFFAYLASLGVLSYKNAYLLFNCVHLFIATYFAFLICKKIFSISTIISILYVIFIFGIAVQGMWYISFFLVATLMIPCLYVLFYHLRWPLNKRQILIASVPFYLLGTTGYAPVTVGGLIVLFFLWTVLYLIKWRDRNINSYLYNLSPLLIGGAINCILFLNIAYYLVKLVKNAGNSVQVFMGGQLSLGDAAGLFFHAVPVATENMELLHIGGPVLLMLFFLFFKPEFLKNEQSRREIGLFLIIGAVTYLICFGGANPFAYIFYFCVPLFGKMHLPVRYLYLTLPVFYLGVVLIVQNLSSKNFSIRERCVVLAIFNVIYFSLGAWLCFNGGVDKEIFIVEVTCQILFSLWFAFRGGITPIMISLACVNLFFVYGNNLFNRELDILGKSDQKSILSPEKTTVLTNLASYVDKLPKKEFYRYQFVRENVLPLDFYIPDNLSWYNLGNRFSRLVSYIGYEPHMSHPITYSSVLGWFDRTAWNYYSATDMDFVVVTRDFIKNRKDANAYLDFENIHDLGDGYCAVPLLTKKYIFSNGIFASNDLSRGDVANVKFLKSGKIEMDIDIRHKSNLTYLFYPTRFTVFKVNGRTVSPAIKYVDNLPLANLSLDPGRNTIVISYNGWLDLAYWLLVCVYLCCIFGAFIFSLMSDFIAFRKSRP